jgi:hypothetical protein
VQRTSSVSHINKYDYVKKLKDMVKTFVQLNYAQNNFSEKILYNYMLDFILGMLNGLFGDLYFSDYKLEYLDAIDNILKSYSENPNTYLNYIKYKKNIKSYKFISYFYWKIIRPIGKHGFVLPYRNIQSRLRSNNAK